MRDSKEVIALDVAAIGRIEAVPSLLLNLLSNAATAQRAAYVIRAAAV